jgi:ATP-dependent DNA helicase RecG
VTTPWPKQEDLRTEFKSDLKGLSDRDLVEAVVCLANTEGGTLYLGVEDDGACTGVNAARNLQGCEAMVANRTSPPIRVAVDVLLVDHLRVVCITVPKSRDLVGTTEGVMKRRRLDAHGQPECVPLLPIELPRRLSDLRAMDPSAQPVPGAALDDLDPVERDRLRQFVHRLHGDAALRNLSDDELDGALELT